MSNQPKSIVRNLDALGRIVLPKKMRTQLGIEIRDSLEIQLDGEYVVLSKPIERCLFCSRKRDVHRYMQRNVCGTCLIDLAGES